MGFFERSRAIGVRNSDCLARVPHGLPKYIVAKAGEQQSAYQQQYGCLLSKSFVAAVCLLLLVLGCKLVSEAVDRSRVILVLLAFPCLLASLLCGLWIVGVAQTLLTSS